MASQYKAEHVCDVCGKTSGQLTASYPNSAVVPLPANWSSLSHDVMPSSGPMSQRTQTVLCDTHTAELVTWRTTPQEPV